MLCINYLSTEIGLRPYSVIICSISYRIVEGHNPRLTDGQMKEEGQAILNMRAEDRSRCFPLLLTIGQDQMHPCLLQEELLPVFTAFQIYVLTYTFKMKPVTIYKGEFEEETQKCYQGT